ncbi:MAG: Uma2 family endonuclease [Rubripirellula sp.]
MTAAKKYIPHYTIEDYARWEGDWELWDGVPVSMAPGPFGRHQKLAGDIMMLLRDALKTAECNAEVTFELDWIVSDDTVVRPDVLVICDGIPDRHLETTPALIVEVLSESTRDRDQTYKRDLYEREGVTVYLIADPDARTLQVLRLNESGKYEVVPESGELRLTICESCELTLAMSSLF